MASDKTSLMDGLRPLLLVSKCLGSQLIDEYKEDRTYRVVIMNKLINLAVTALLVVIFFFGLPKCNEDFETLVSAITTHLQRYSNLFFCFSIRLLIYTNRKRIASIVFRLEEMDGRLGVSKRLKYVAMRRRVLLLLWMEFVINLVMILIDYLPYLDNWSVFLCCNTYTVAYLVSMISQAQILIFLNELKIRFRVLNELAAYKIVGPDKRKDLLDCCAIHGDLCEIGKMINGSYEKQITIKIMVAFIYITTSVFYISIELKNDVERNQYEYVSYAYFVLLESFDVIFLVYGFGAVAQEAKRFVSIVFSKGILKKKNGGDFNKIMELFAFQLHFRNCNFTACQLFAIDGTVIHSIVVSIFTYLIFLYQFEFVV